MPPDQPNSAVCSCGYDRAGLPTDVCPECGLTIATNTAWPNPARARHWRALRRDLPFALAMFTALLITAARNYDDSSAYALTCITFSLVSVWLWTGRVLERARWRIALLVLPIPICFVGYEVEMTSLIVLQLPLVAWLLGHRRHQTAMWATCAVVFLAFASLLLIGSSEGGYWSRFNIGLWYAHPMPASTSAMWGGALMLIALVAAVLALHSFWRPQPASTPQGQQSSDTRPSIPR